LIAVRAPFLNRRSFPCHGTLATSYILSVYGLVGRTTDMQHALPPRVTLSPSYPEVIRVLTIRPYRLDGLAGTLDARRVPISACFIAALADVLVERPRYLSAQQVQFTLVGHICSRRLFARPRTYQGGVAKARIASLIFHAVHPHCQGCGHSRKRSRRFTYQMRDFFLRVAISVACSTSRYVLAALRRRSG